MAPKKIPCPRCGLPMSRRSEVCRECYTEITSLYWAEEHRKAPFHCTVLPTVLRSSLVFGLAPCDGCSFTPSPDRDSHPPYYGVPQTHRSSAHGVPMCADCCVEHNGYRPLDVQ